MDEATIRAAIEWWNAELQRSGSDERISVEGALQFWREGRSNFLGRTWSDLVAAWQAAGGLVTPPGPLGRPDRAPIDGPPGASVEDLLSLVSVELSSIQDQTTGSIQACLLQVGQTVDTCRQTALEAILDALEPAAVLIPEVDQLVRLWVEGQLRAAALEVEALTGVNPFSKVDAGQSVGSTSPPPALSPPAGGFSCAVEPSKMEAAKAVSLGRDGLPWICRDREIATGCYVLDGQRVQYSVVTPQGAAHPPHYPARLYWSEPAMLGGADPFRRIMLAGDDPLPPALWCTRCDISTTAGEIVYHAADLDDASDWPHALFCAGRLPCDAGSGPPPPPAPPPAVAPPLPADCMRIDLASCLGLSPAAVQSWLRALWCLLPDECRRVGAGLPPDGDQGGRDLEGIPPGTDEQRGGLERFWDTARGIGTINPPAPLMLPAPPAILPGLNGGK